MEILPSFSERNGSDIDNRTGIGSPILKQAVKEAIDIVDASTLETILDSLAKKGIDLDKESSSYTLEQLEVAFADFFGVEAGSLLMDRIRLWLKNNGH